jgi:hypothetical protein
MSERDITEKLYAPAYWISGSAEGHEGENDAPYRDAAEIDRLRDDAARLAAENEKLRAAITPRPIEEAPKDREVIGVERPPFEDCNYFHMGRWNKEHQKFMADAGYDRDTGAQRWAFCGVTHYIDPQSVPLLPEHIFEDGDIAIEDETRTALQDKSDEPAVTQWQPIETAPKDGRSILVWAPGQEPEKAKWDSQPDCNCWCIDVVGPWDCNPLYFVPTRWMPLLPPPEDKSDEPGEGNAASEGAKG